MRQHALAPNLTGRQSSYHSPCSVPAYVLLWVEPRVGGGLQYWQGSQPRWFCRCRNGGLFPSQHSGTAAFQNDRCWCYHARERLGCQTRYARRNQYQTNAGRDCCCCTGLGEQAHFVQEAMMMTRLWLVVMMLVGTAEVVQSPIWI